MATKVVVIRLLKQSAIPATLALSYALWRNWPVGPVTKITTVIESFATAFFLVSWFVGQILRTTKQVHDEKHFQTIIQRLDGFDAKSVETLKAAYVSQIDAEADLIHLQASVKLLVPEHIKGMIYSLHLDKGDPVNAAYVMPWAVGDEALAIATKSLKAAEERARV